MTELKQLSFEQRAQRIQALTTSLGLTLGDWGLMACVLFERSQTLWAIKEAATGRYVYASEGMQTLMQRWQVGMTDEDWLSPAVCIASHMADQSAMVQTVPQVSEHRFEVKPLVPEQPPVKSEFSVTRFPLTSQNGKVSHVCCLWVDQTPHKQLQEQHQQALAQLEALQKAQIASHAGEPPLLHEGATDFRQYNHFEDQLRREIDLSLREHREFAVVRVALDHLPSDLTQLGASAFERVSETLGRLLRSNTRAMDASCHTEDGQFVVLLSGVGLATAHSRMESLRRQCATQMVLFDGQDFRFSVSMGVASFPHTARTQAEILAAAQAALAEAQRRGGNHVALASIRFETNHML